MTKAYKIKQFVFIAFALMVTSSAFAKKEQASQFEHQLIRRVVVFPIKTAPENQELADEAWWQMRELLTEGQRFLVASKQFLIRNDVLQARESLEPADAILLGRLLDSHALMVSILENRVLKMKVYDGLNGVLLYSQEARLHPSVAIKDQLVKVARLLVADFMASFPYQGFHMIDPLIGRAVYEEGDILLAQVDVGVKSKIEAGDPVEWIQMSGFTTQALFQGGAKVSAFAEGRVVKVEQNIATVEVVRATKGAAFKEFQLVRFPKEAQRLKAEFSYKEGMRNTIESSLVAPEINPMESLKKERRPLMTTLSIVGSIAGFLLLAF